MEKQWSGVKIIVFIRKYEIKLLKRHKSAGISDVLFLWHIFPLLIMLKNTDWLSLSKKKYVIFVQSANRLTKITIAVKLKNNAFPYY